MKNYSIITVEELAEMLYNESGKLTHPTGYIDYSIFLNSPLIDDNIITNRGMGFQYLFGNLCLVSGKWNGGWTTVYDIDCHSITDVKSLMEVIKEDFECFGDTLVDETKRVIINPETLWHDDTSPILKEAV